MDDAEDAAVAAALAATAVGGTRLVRPDPMRGQTVRGFQKSVTGLLRLRDAGAIEIIELHVDLLSLEQLVDHVIFRRLR
jgi:hypothetical protein